MNSDGVDEAAAPSRPDAVTARPRTALISWSHSEPGWKEAEHTERMIEVLAIAEWLRSNGVDVDVDLYQEGAPDWTRWGPKRVAEVDFVLIMTSLAWRRAWDGTGDPTVGVGARAEADALKSLQQNRDEFMAKVRLVIPPSATEESIPVGLHGVNRFRIINVPDEGLVSLLRDLTGQAAYPRPPLGSVPVLAPLSTRRPPSGSVRIAQRRHATARGDLQMAVPEFVTHSEIQEQVDALVDAEIREFNNRESKRADDEWNYASVRWIPTLVSDRLVSFLVDRSFALPGAAPGYQNSLGVIFEANTGRRLGLSDVFLDDQSWRETVWRCFEGRVREMFNGEATANELPDPLTFAITESQVGIATERYNVLPGVFGAPTVWIDHERLDRFYRSDFVRRIRGDRL